MVWAMFAITTRPACFWKMWKFSAATSASRSEFC
jgi:hypothetical protein